MTNRAHALAYAARGWRVIPIPPGKKYPGIDGWETLGTTDTDQITAWWTTNPDHGVGILTGRASNLWVLDIDIDEGKVGEESLRDLEDGYTPLPATYEVITGSGGRHLYFTWPTDPDVIIRNDQSGRIGVDLDVRGDGGFVMAPPSIHPKYAPARWEQSVDSAPDPVAAPDWLVALARYSEPEPRPVTLSEPAGDRPGDIWAATTTWGDILGADGWTLHHVDRTGEEHWTRPGKERRDGTSATTGYKGSDVLKVFTSSMTSAGLHAEETYTKLGYLAATRHGGDHAAAARALRAEGHHAPSGPAIVLAPSGNPSATGPDGGPAPAPLPDEPWVDPIPLGGTHVLPPFPTHIYPDWITDYVHEVATDIQVPVDLPATLALGALSTVAAGHLKIHVDGRWTEHANLYLVVAMPPSTGKSPAYKRMCGPVLELEKEYQRQVRAEIGANADMVEAIEAELKRTKQLQDVDPKSLVEIRERLYAAQEKPTTLPKLTVGDVTPEALGKLISENSGRMALHSTEGGVFGIMTGRYAEGVNLDVYLQAWSGDRIDTHRIGRESNSTDEALLTVVITVQPNVIGDLAKTPELAGRGLTARFMYAIPPDCLGERDLSLRGHSDPGSHDRYGDELRTLGRRFMSWNTPATLAIDPAAAQHYTDWRQALEARRKPDGDLRPMAEWTGKLESSVLRAAALLHLAWGHRHDDPVTVETIARAINLGEYWLAHAGHVHDLWGTSPDIAVARRILAWAETQGRTEFTVRELYAADRSTFKKADDTLGPLQLLVERGWIRTSDGGPVTTQRNKRSVSFALHPELSTSEGRSARSVQIRESHGETEWMATEGEATTTDPELSTVSARSARSVLRGVSQTLTLSSHGRPGVGGYAQNAQNAQNHLDADQQAPDAQNAQNEATCGQPDEDDDPWDLGLDTDDNPTRNP